MIAAVVCQVPGFDKGKDNHTTLVGIKDGSVYLSNMTFVGDDDQSRAIEVHSSAKAYCSGAIAWPLLRACCLSFWVDRSF